jgi:hypothetical protein
MAGPTLTVERLDAAMTRTANALGRAMPQALLLRADPDVQPPVRWLGRPVDS